MNAILEAPVLTTDIEDETAAPPQVRDRGEGWSFPPTDFCDTKHSAGKCFLEGSTATVAGSKDFALLPGINGSVPDTRREVDSKPLVPPSLPQPPGAALREEFDLLYHTYQRKVYRQCYRMLGNHEDAEDLTQEVFLQLFRKADTFRGESSFSTWLHRLTINTVLMQMRRYRRWRGAMTSLDAPPAAEDGAGDVAAVLNSLPAPVTSPVDKIRLEMAIAQLATGYKAIFLLHDQEGYRHDEIAKLLSINEGTSKSQLHKARLRLRHLVSA